MAFVRTDKAKSEKEKNSKGFTATSSLKIDSDYVEKKRKKASDKLTDFADRYTALMKDAEKYLTRAENEPIETGVTANTKKGNTLAGEAVKSNVSGRKTSAYSPSTAGKASSKAKAAAEWADSILKADTLKSEAGNIKSEAAKLLKELEGDKSYMSTEMYNTYKELLSSVANDNSTGLSDALTGKRSSARTTPTETITLPKRRTTKSSSKTARSMPRNISLMKTPIFSKLPLLRKRLSTETQS